MRDGRIFDMDAVLAKIAQLDVENTDQIWTQNEQSWDMLTGLP